MYSRSSTIPANWVKIGPVDVEIIGRTELLKIKKYIPGGPKKTSRTLRNYNGAYTLWGEISFDTFVDQ